MSIVASFSQILDHGIWNAPSAPGLMSSLPAWNVLLVSCVTMTVLSGVAKEKEQVEIKDFPRRFGENNVSRDA
jgi:hypothetical protein